MIPSAQAVFIEFCECVNRVATVQAVNGYSPFVVAELLV